MFLSGLITLSTIAIAAALEWSDTSDPYGLTDHFILSITEIAKRGEYTERSVDKMNTLNLPLLLVICNLFSKLSLKGIHGRRRIHNL